MQEYVKAFLDKFDYLPEDRAVLCDALDKIVADEVQYAQFLTLLKTYQADAACDKGALREQMQGISSCVGIHQYTGDLLLYICLSKYLEEHYKKAGLSLDIYQNSVYDLKYKLAECRAVYGVCGSFVGGWFDRFFDMTRFAFGKLQFELIEFGDHYQKGDLVLSPQQAVINVHIPRTGSKLDRESMHAAYAQAAAFFAPTLGEGAVVFVCESWLLFPPNLDMLRKESNLFAFISQYDIYKSGEYEDHHDLWRLFDMNYTGDADKLPQDTSLRCAYVARIKRGEATGWGRGVYVYHA